MYKLSNMHVFGAKCATVKQINLFAEKLNSETLKLTHKVFTALSKTLQVIEAYLHHVSCPKFSHNGSSDCP